MKSETIGVKIIVTTNEDREFFEEQIDILLDTMSNRTKLDLVCEMTEEEIIEEYKLKNEGQFNTKLK